MSLCIYRGKGRDGQYRCMEDDKRCYFRLFKCVFKEFARSVFGLFFILMFVGFTFLAVGLWQAAEERVVERQAQVMAEVE